MSIDGGDSLSRNDNVEVDPGANKHHDQHKTDQRCKSPDGATLELNLFFVGKMLSPPKNKRLPITLGFNTASRLPVVASCFIRARRFLAGWSLRWPLCLTFHSASLPA